MNLFEDNIRDKSQYIDKMKISVEHLENKKSLQYQCRKNISVSGTYQYVLWDVYYTTWTRENQTDQLISQNLSKQATNQLDNKRNKNKILLTTMKLLIYMHSRKILLSRISEKMNTLQYKGLTLYGHESKWSCNKRIF